MDPRSGHHSVGAGEPVLVVDDMEGDPGWMIEVNHLAPLPEQHGRRHHPGRHEEGLASEGGGRGGVRMLAQHSDNVRIPGHQFGEPPLAELPDAINVRDGEDDRRMAETDEDRRAAR